MYMHVLIKVFMKMNRYWMYNSPLENKSHSIVCYYSSLFF